MGLFVDNFAGGGGASTGIEMAIGRSVDIAINHDPDAIAMHRANHPQTRHFCENIWQVDPANACAGDPVTLAWFSPDCKHFSRAKGGKPLDKNIRGLAWVTIKWAYTVRPRVIMLENVAEIQTWGPLEDDGKPDKKRSGETFDGFIRALSTGIPENHPAFAEMCDALDISTDSETAGRLTAGLGYDVEYRLLKSCDYGAPTSRNRFYMIARCDGEKITWPDPTHGDRSSSAVREGRRKPYRPVAECLDFSDLGASIFERKKPLAEKTLRRIARGIKKFVIENPDPFIIAGQAPFLTKFQQNSVGQTVREPIDTVMAGATRFGVVAPTLIQYHSETGAREVRGQSVNDPIMTVDTNPRYALAVAHIMKNYGGGYTGAGSAADDPVGTVTAADHNALVATHIAVFRNHADGQSVREPLRTVTAKGNHYAAVQAFLLKYYGNEKHGQSISDPLGTVTANNRFALVTVHGTDYVIVDITMRMLKPRELFNAQGFPDDYIIDRDADGRPYSRTKQVARCGNAVTPPVPAALVRANLPEECVKIAGGGGQ